MSGLERDWARGAGRGGFGDEPLEHAGSDDGKDGCAGCVPEGLVDGDDVKVGGLDDVAERAESPVEKRDYGDGSSGRGGNHVDAGDDKHEGGDGG